MKVSLATAVAAAAGMVPLDISAIEKTVSAAEAFAVFASTKEGDDHAGR